ncbi:hypothetical protein AMS58_18205 [Pseudoalteromonas porphyrae]|uniref:Sodium:solute symporter n=1 Tax=Pseudoalteromonas porphyrae TaxID=187330 RepID=A0A0N1MT82_9GAMM|nr:MULTISPECIES: hypothetical protein [Pseudoalteromonas]KPH60164.1 hypothetical protein ADS77_16015 [Pseudoalteromonas porphyrae]KPH93227.1 hypothetical protein AMS58_18205 [Pseudoalteromonas porphyrae]
MTPELTLLILAVTVISLGYGFIYPRFAGNDFKKVSMQDLIATGITLMIAGSLYYNSGIEFSWLAFKVNWFWFTFLTYVVIEIPVCLVYAKKHNMKFS